MKCWECKKELLNAHRAHYIEFHEEQGLSKEKGRDICNDCYKLLKFDACYFVRVEKITGRQLNLKFLKVKEKDENNNLY